MSRMALIRITGLIEAISALVLFLIAMPLKYGLGMKMAVTVVGSLHGFLLIIFMVVIFVSYLEKKISGTWFWILFIASIIPFGPLFVDGRLKAMDQESANKNTPTQDY